MFYEFALAAIKTVNGTATLDPEHEDPNSRSMAIVSFFLIFYIVVMFLALGGNTLVLLAVYKYKFMRNVVNLFLANLACSDFLFALVSVFDTTAYMLSGWYAGEASCKIQSYLIEVFYTCSILTLVAVSCERYLAICRPHLKSRSRSVTVKIIAFLWLASAGFCAILLYAYRINTVIKSVPICDNLNWSYTDRKVFYTIHSFFVYFLPLTVMILAHHRISLVIASHRVPSARPVHKTQQKQPEQGEGKYTPRSGDDDIQLETQETSPESSQEQRIAAAKESHQQRWYKRKTSTSKFKLMRKRKKVIKILITVTITFFALWTPFIVCRMLMYYDVMVNVYLWKGTQLLILSSTAVNGLIYALMSPQFRRCFKHLLPCCRGNAADGESMPSRGREMNSTSNSMTITRTASWRSKSFVPSFRLPRPFSSKRS
eukprot:gene4682-5297_t